MTMTTTMTILTKKTTMTTTSNAGLFPMVLLSALMFPLRPGRRVVPAVKP